MMVLHKHRLTTEFFLFPHAYINLDFRSKLKYHSPHIMVPSWPARAQKKRAYMEPVKTEAPSLNSAKAETTNREMIKTIKTSHTWTHVHHNECPPPSLLTTTCSGVSTFGYGVEDSHHSRKGMVVGWGC